MIAVECTGTGNYSIKRTQTKRLAYTNFLDNILRGDRDLVDRNASMDKGPGTSAVDNSTRKRDHCTTIVSEEAHQDLNLDSNGKN